MKYFVGLTFNENCLQTQSLKNFQKRIDPYGAYAYPLQISLLPAFSTPVLRSEMIEDLSDALEGMFLGGREDSSLYFECDDFRYKKRGDFFLKAKTWTNMKYAREKVDALLKGEQVEYKGVHFHRKMEPVFPPLRLVLGRCHDGKVFSDTYKAFKESVDAPLLLAMKDVMLFEKRERWTEKIKLFSFNHAYCAKSLNTYEHIHYY